MNRTPSLLDARTEASHLKRLAVTVLAVLAAFVPFALGNYANFVMSEVLVLIVALLGLNLLTGYCGQISLGHGAIYALGAYSLAILLKNDFPCWAAIPLAGAFCFVCGFLFGWPALRLEGLYLALATFALAVAVPSLLKDDALSRWTGGVQGLSIDKPVPPWFWPLGPDHWFYLICLVTTVFLYVIVRNLVNSRVGRALIAIRENALAASAIGINRPLYTAITFGISALVTGIGGALGALGAEFVSPDSFPPFLSISFLVGIIVGGVGTMSGPLFGAAFLYAMPQIAERISKGAPWAIYGVVLLVVIYTMPTGLSAMVKRLWKQ